MKCRGQVWEKTLATLGMHTMGDVRGHIASILHAFTPKIAAFLLRASLGVGEEEVEAESQGRKGAVATIDSFFPHAHAPAPTAPGDGDACNVAVAAAASPTTREIPKSLGHRRTFALDCRSATEQRAKLQELCEMVAASLKEKHLHGLTATLTLKTSAFEETARAATAECHVQSAVSIHRLLRPLLDAQVAMRCPCIPSSTSASRLPSASCSRSSRLVRAVGDDVGRGGHACDASHLLLPVSCLVTAGDTARCRRACA